MPQDSPVVRSPVMTLKPEGQVDIPQQQLAFNVAMGVICPGAPFVPA